MKACYDVTVGVGPKFVCRTALPLSIPRARLIISLVTSSDSLPPVGEPRRHEPADAMPISAKINVPIIESHASANNRAIIVQGKRPQFEQKKGNGSCHLAVEDKLARFLSLADNVRFHHPLTAR